MSSGIKMFENIKVEEVGNGGSISMSHPSGVFAAQTFTVIQKRNFIQNTTSQRASDFRGPMTPGRQHPDRGCRTPAADRPQHHLRMRSRGQGKISGEDGW